MNEQMPCDDSDRPAVADDALRMRLREALQPHTPAVDALSARVLAQWNEQHADPVVATARLGGSGAAAAAAVLGVRASRRRWWAGVTTGLLGCVVVAALVWLQRPDPALEELMQTDVLSQMAIDEM